VKAAFHDADTNILAVIPARIVARMSACRATFPFSLPQEIARIRRVGEYPREDVGVGVVECGLENAARADVYAVPFPLLVRCVYFSDSR